MRIVTPQEVANQTQNKYLGVLVAAKFARFVNEFPRDRSVEFEQKLTTRALGGVGAGPPEVQAGPAAAAGGLMSVAGRHVVLGVSGGIACYKSCTLARRLTEQG